MKKGLLFLLIFLTIHLNGQIATSGGNDSILNKKIKPIDSGLVSPQNLINLTPMIYSFDIKRNTILESTKIISNADVKFQSWLKSYGLTNEIFRDTIIQDAFELWAYKEPFNKANQSLLQISSPDSSYTLLTNFDKNNIPKIKDLLFFKFLNNKSQKVYIGIVFLEDRFYEIVDYHWFDKQTIFILDKYENGIYELRKLVLGVNKLWIYKTRKINAP